MLTERDRKLLEALPFEPLARPAYDELGGFLAWPDELPAGLTPDGHEYVRELLIARRNIHDHQPPETWRPRALVMLWQEARSNSLQWNGFRRLTLSTADEAFLAAARAEDDP